MKLTGEAKVLISIALVTLIFVIGAALFMGGKSSQPDTQSQPIAADVLVREDSYKIEVKEAKVTLVEFLDPECESCRAAHPMVKQILKEYEGKINFVIRYFPLHKNSVLAVKAAEAAGEQDKYWEMIDMLFENQGDWGEKSEPQTVAFLSYAEKLDLDINKFKADLNNKAYEDKIERDKNDGLNVGVQGTPTFFINGVLVDKVRSYEEFKSKIDSELDK